VQRALEVRASHPVCFDEGAAYRPLFADGPEAERVVALERGERIVAVVPRFLVRAGGRMPDATLALAPGRYVEAFTGRALSVAGALDVVSLLEPFPMALLVRGEPRA
jgi:maltooligosyltrehalose synthase